MSTQQDRFLAALRRLQDWHVDAVKAVDYNSPATSSSKPGSTHFRAQRYPDTGRWLAEWRYAAGNDIRKELIIQEMEGEIGRFAQRVPTISYRDHWGKTRYRTITGDDL